MKDVINKQEDRKVKQSKTALAKKMGISRGMLYYQHKRPVEDEKLKEKIIEVMKRNESYGHKRIAIDLKLNKKRILRVMKKFHLVPIKRRGKKPVKPDDINKSVSRFKNEIETFCPLKPNIVWVGDFTYIRYQDTWIYFATVMDIYTREIIGWHILTTHTKDLVIEALLDALDRKRCAPLYFHSDQGSEYESDEYVQLLTNNEIMISMSRKSHPWENGYQESFYSGFKLDLGSTTQYQEIGKLVEAISQKLYYYNNQRIHTALKMSPNDFRLSREYLFNKLGT